MNSHFLDLHHSERPLLMPNPWDVGSAKLLESIGFKALANTSSGFAATLGRLDGSVTREEALSHCATLVAATEVPVSADLENAFADDPEGVAQTVRLAIDARLAGRSGGDFPGRADDPISPLEQAAERIAAAAEAAHAGPGSLVLTARSENFLHGRKDLADTIARLQAFQEAGADVLYAPGIRSADDIRSIVESVDRPVNVLAVPGVPTVVELAELGVSRVSVGGGFAFVAAGALIAAGRELLEQGTYSFWETAGVGYQATHEAFE